MTCSKLRKVCTFDRAQGTIAISRSGVLTTRDFFPSNSGWSQAAAFAVLLTGLSTSAIADGWTPVAATTQWQTRTNFVENFSAPVTDRAVPLAGSRKLDQLLSLIAMAEADNGYDSVQHGARIKPPARPTSMTIAQIDA